MLIYCLAAVFIVASLILNPVKSDPPITCTNLGVPSTCVIGRRADGSCQWEVYISHGTISLVSCTPINCAEYQADSTCSCGDGTVVEATNCQRFGCACQVNCTAMGAVCTKGIDDQCNLYEAQCSLDCTARNQKCIALPEYVQEDLSINMDIRCFVTQGGTCMGPSTTTMTTMPSTTTATAAETTTNESYYRRPLSLDNNYPQKPYYSFRETDL